MGERPKTLEVQRLRRQDRQQRLRPHPFQSQSRLPRPWTCMLASASFVSKILGMCALGAGTAVCATSASRHSCSSHGLHVRLVDSPSQRATVRCFWARMSQQKNRLSILDRQPDCDWAAVRVGTWLAARGPRGLQEPRAGAMSRSFVRKIRSARPAYPIEQGLGEAALDARNSGQTIHETPAFRLLSTGNMKKGTYRALCPRRPGR